MDLLDTRLKHATKITYRAVGSSTGRAEFVAGANDFGCSELPLSTEVL
jgi:ABC-type phosphate transport system substrate-binding protein